MVALVVKDKAIYTALATKRKQNDQGTQWTI